MTFNMSPLLKARRMDPQLRNFAASGGRSATGRQQTVFSDAGFWMLDIAQLVVRNQAQAWAYDAMIARLRQGEPMVVTLCTPYRFQPSSPVTLAAPASLRATSLTITGLAADLTAGQKFSIGNRLYQITDVIDEASYPVGLVTAVSGADLWDDGDVWVDDAEFGSQLKILPPLRASALSGAALSFSTLKMTVRLNELASGDLSLDLGRFGTPDLSLVEDI